MSKTESFRITGTRTTSEIWMPCAPIIQHLQGRQFYVASISFCLLDGRGVARSFGEFSTFDEALGAAIDRAKVEPRPELSEIVG
jgi:hypothetical protein